MGNQEDEKPTKTEKPSSPPPLDQAHVQVYPDWAAAQAYYGPRLALNPYYNSAVPPGFAPHPYMWGLPQHMLPPYGTPYAASYSHGGVYAHHAASITPPTPGAAETPSKSSGDGGRGLMKKLKSFDGIGMSITNGNAETADNGAKPRVSESTETEATSDGSDGNTSGADHIKRKRVYEGTAAGGKYETGSASDANCKAPAEAWISNDRELKRERRKQSNRESARRSRLRKQAEAEELANRVGYLTAENAALTSEINRLMEDSKNLRRENAKLVEKLNHCGGGGTGSDTEVDEEPLSLTTENLLSKVDNAGSSQTSTEEGEGYGRSPNLNAGSKLRQLLAGKPRADPVAAT